MLAGALRLLTAAGLLAVVAGAGLLPPARALGADSAVVDCNAHLRLTRHYTASQLRDALNTMPGDVKEYTNCYDVIQRQLISELGGTGVKPTSSGSGGGSFLPAPVIALLAVVLLGGVGYAAISARRRRPGRPPGED